MEVPKLFKTKKSQDLKTDSVNLNYYISVTCDQSGQFQWDRVVSRERLDTKWSSGTAAASV